MTNLRECVVAPLIGVVCGFGIGSVVIMLLKLI